MNRERIRCFSDEDLKLVDADAIRAKVAADFACHCGLDCPLCITWAFQEKLALREAITRRKTSLRSRKYYNQNKKEINRRARVRRMKSPERYRETARKYYLKNKERIDERSKKYREANKERLNKIARDNARVKTEFLRLGAIELN